MENNQSVQHESGSSDDSMESPPEMRLKELQREYKQSVQVFRHLLDRSLKDLQANVKALYRIADSYESWYRGTTIGSLTGGIIGAAGGVTTLFGLAMAPFTFGLSMAVAGVGMGIGAVGGITGAASNISSMVSQHCDLKDIHKIQKDFLEKVQPIQESLNKINCRVENLKAISYGTAMTGVGVYKITVSLTCLDDFVKLSAKSAKSLRAAAALTGVLSGLLLVIDIINIVKDAKDLEAMKDGNKIQSDTLRFIQTIRDMAKEYEQVVDTFVKTEKELDRLVK